MTAFFVLVLGSYFFFMLALLVGWKRSLAGSLPESADDKFISVLVPFRNEEMNLERLVHSLSSISYPKEYYEIILIDDHSTDNSLNVARSLISGLDHISVINSSGAGKKKALATGVTAAKGEIVLTTDADCEVPMEWLTIVNKIFQDDKVQMAFGGVSMESNNSFFFKLQSLEFLSLIGSGAATLGLGFFSMCNGANLAFRKSAFLAVDGYKGNETLPSGDDEFLARKVINKFPGSLRFVNNKNAVVITSPMSSLAVFVSQRIRWAGKWRYNDSFVTKGLAVFIAAVQLAFLYLVVGLLLKSVSLWPSFLVVGLKFLMEAIFLSRVSAFLGTSLSWFAFVCMQFVYPFYVLGIGMTSLRSGYEWKGRSLSHKM